MIKIDPGHGGGAQIRNVWLFLYLLFILGFEGSIFFISHNFYLLAQYSRTNRPNIP